jgi:hypothetical protein
MMKHWGCKGMLFSLSMQVLQGLVQYLTAAAKDAASAAALGMRAADARAAAGADAALLAALELLNSLCSAR